MKDYAYLLFVDEINNHNKYYEITLNDDNSIDVNYGRVGNTPAYHHYEAHEKQFHVLKSVKEAKGYKDVTALHSVKTASNAMAKNEELDYKPVEDTKINNLIEELITSAREFVKVNYTVGVQEITPKMVSEAENDLNTLISIAQDSNVALWRFNEQLKELFVDIPRRMGDVGCYLAKTSADFSRIIERERDMLDNIKGQVNTIVAPSQDNSQKKDTTVLDAYGLSVSPVTYEEEDQILSHLGKDYGGLDVDRRYVTAYKVENSATRKAYEEFKATHQISRRDCKLFYHGSKVENWWSIMKTGLSLNPNASVTGKMFGNGLYFASDCRKSLNYMDTKSSHWNNGKRDSGYMAIYSVALGKCYEPYNALYSSFNKKDLPNGCLSVYADKRKTGLQNDEYVVYDQAQCTIKYLVEMKDYNCRNKYYNLDRRAFSNAFKTSLSSLKKTKNSYEAEVLVDNLSDSASKEFYDKISRDYDFKNCYIKYNPRSDNVVFSFKGYDGTTTVCDGNYLTADDKAYLCREFKKAYVLSEKDWANLNEEAKCLESGKTIAKPLAETEKRHRNQLSR